MGCSQCWELHEANKKRDGGGRELLLLRAGSCDDSNMVLRVNANEAMRVLTERLR
jgi:hypothetical protein